MTEHMKIAVAGATGRAGRHVVDLLRAQGHDAVPMSRATGVDVSTGDGLAQALEGAGAIIDVATGPSPEQGAATAFFTTAARNLHEAGERAGVRTMVVASIIGVDRFSSGYNAAKLAHEQAAQAGPVPTRILRAAQFHEFVGRLLAWGTRGEVAYVPRMRTQLVAARAVAQGLIDLATATSGAPPLSEIAGPREEDLAAMARLLAARDGGPATIEEVSDPEDPDAELYASGALLPGPDVTLAGPTFEAWLQERYAPKSAV